MEHLRIQIDVLKKDSIHSDWISIIHVKCKDTLVDHYPLMRNTIFDEESKTKIITRLIESSELNMVGEFQDLRIGYLKALHIKCDRIYSSIKEAMDNIIVFNFIQPEGK